MKREVLFSLVGFIALIFVSVSLVNVSAQTDSFSTSLSSFKLTVDEGDRVIKEMTLNAQESGFYSVNVVGVEGVSLERSGFSLDSGDSTNLKFVVDSSKLEKGANIGKISIAVGTESLEIPLIIEVQSQDLIVDVNLDVAPNYLNSVRGDEIVVKAKIFDLISGGTKEGLGNANVNLNLVLYDLEGNALDQISEEIVLSRQAEITNAFDLKENKYDEGQYVLAGVVEIRGSVGTSSVLFNVNEKTLVAGTSGEDNLVIFVIVVILIIVIACLIFVRYLMKDRDALIRDLRRNNNFELQQQKDLLENQRRMAREKGLDEKKIKKEIDEKVKNLKEKQEKRIDKLKSMKKKGDLTLMKKQVESWKKQGYKLGDKEYKLKDLSKKDMEKTMKDWKKKYKI